MHGEKTGWRAGIWNSSFPFGLAISSLDCLLGHARLALSFQLSATSEHPLDTCDESFRKDLWKSQLGGWAVKCTVAARC